MGISEYQPMECGEIFGKRGGGWGDLKDKERKKKEKRIMDGK